MIAVVPFDLSEKLFIVLMFFHRTDEDGFTGETTNHSHMIVVVDSKLQQYVRSHIIQYDQIFLEGHLHYQLEPLENGTRRMSGCIIPFHIEKI